MPQLNVYIGFNGDCRRAMEFYRDCIGGELTMHSLNDMSACEEYPPYEKHTIVHAALVKEQLVIMGTDMVGPDGYIKGNNIALCLNCDSEDALDTYYCQLSEGGKVLAPLGKSVWGDTFGCFTDKFGITWMLNYHEIKSSSI